MNLDEIPTDTGDSLWSLEGDDNDLPSVPSETDPTGQVPDTQDEPSVMDEQLDASENTPTDDQQLEQEDNPLDDPDLTGKTEPKEDDGPLVKMDDGTEVPLSELQSGYLRQADYTQKTQEVAQHRDALEQSVQRYEQNHAEFEAIRGRLVEYVQGLIPPEPALALAREKPEEYQYQTAIRAQAVAEVQKLLDIGQMADMNRGNAQGADLNAIKQREDTALVNAFPALRDPARMAKFDSDFQVTAKEFGFSEDEIGSTYDHRIKRVLHYARIGRQSTQNRSNAQRRIVSRHRSQGRAATTPARNANAMSRLAKTGSLDDAMKVEIAY